MSVTTVDRAGNKRNATGEVHHTDALMRSLFSLRIAQPDSVLATLSTRFKHAVESLSRGNVSPVLLNSEAEM